MLPIRNNVTVGGNEAGRPLLFVHGFGCSQEMWRLLTPAFVSDHRLVLFDHVGSGRSDLAAYERRKYDSLHGYADDLLEIMEYLDLRDVVCVAHSVGSMIAVLAQDRDPSRFGGLVLVGPSPRYIDAEDYHGGFSQADIHALLDSLDANYLGWSASIAPTIIGNSDRPELVDELVESFCRCDPGIARHFARVTFLSDTRRELARVSVPTLVVQCSDDVIAPPDVGAYVHAAIPGSQLVVLTARDTAPISRIRQNSAPLIRVFIQ